MLNQSNSANAISWTTKNLNSNNNKDESMFILTILEKYQKNENKIFSRSVTVL